MKTFRKHFITGLLTLLPIWLVWVVFKFVFVLLSEIGRPVVEPILQRIAESNADLFGWLGRPAVMTIVALLGTVFIIVAVGVAVRRVVGQRALAWIDALIARIPFARTIYGSTRKLIDLLQTKPGSTERVVLIDFPHAEMKSVGLVTRTLQDAGTGREVAAVYVPTTPNPTSGYLELVPVDLLTPTDWTVDEAMSFIISGGAVSRDKIPFTSRDRGGVSDS